MILEIQRVTHIKSGFLKYYHKSGTMHQLKIILLSIFLGNANDGIFQWPQYGKISTNKSILEQLVTYPSVRASEPCRRGYTLLANACRLHPLLRIHSIQYSNLPILMVTFYSNQLQRFLNISTSLMHTWLPQWWLLEQSHYGRSCQSFFVNQTRDCTGS